MKKFWNLMLAALVIFGAVACTEKENVEAQPEQKSGLSFEATIDLGETRTDVVFNEGTEKWETVWTGNETLTVKHGYASFYQFKNSVEDKNHFVCTDNNAENLIGQSVEIFLTHDADYNTLNSKAGKAGGNIEAKVDSFDPAKGVTLEVKSAFLRYSSEYDVTLDASAYIFDYNGQVRNTITLPAGEDVWVAVNKPVTGTVNLSYSIDGDVVKTKEGLTIEAKKIYNLGTLAKPEPEPEMTTVYLVPGVWASDNAIFTVYYWDGEYKNEVEMTKDDTKSGVYKADVRATSDGLIFKRLDPTGMTEWNKTADLTLPTDSKDHYYITDWAAGEWKEYVVTEWALAGTFNSWGDAPMTRINASISYVANVSLTAYTDQFKVKVNGDAKWTTSYGAGYGYMEPNRFMIATFGGGNIAVTETGTYDIYFDEVNTLIYVVTAGSDYTTAVEQTANGPAPVVGNKYYFKPNSNWTQSNAKFSAYFWNNGGNQWAELEDGDGDGVYECNLGEWTPTNVIFLRKDPSGFVYNNWTCWDRIGNITVKSGMNFYTMASGVWSQQIESGNGYTGGTWSVK